MRNAILLASLLPCCVTSWACTARSGTGADAAVTGGPDARGAASPGEAYERLIQATADADEQACRNVTVVAPPGGFADASIDALFASFRLHRAVREKGVTGKRVRSAGFDRNERLLVPEPPEPQLLGQAMEKIREMKWTIEGD